ncbi:MAG: hypothetical protein WC842_01370 [Candidatus Paceibacterota bacterium]|jgi:hypothetical protein
MKNKKQFVGQLNTTIIFFVLFFGFFSSSYAGNPELIVTWRADNFYPTTYVGKAIPSSGTKIYVAIEAFQDGKLLDISKSVIEWRKNRERIQQGMGQKETIVVFNENDETNFVSVSVGWNGGSLEKSITIPVAKPRLILELPYVNGVVPKNTDIAITAMPYFFNAKSFSDLSFSWQIGALKRGTGSDNKIIINTGNPSVAIDRIVTINGYIQNRRSLLEITRTQTKMIIGE